MQPYQMVPVVSMAVGPTSPASDGAILQPGTGMQPVIAVPFVLGGDGVPVMQMVPAYACVQAQPFSPANSHHSGSSLSTFAMEPTPPSSPTSPQFFAGAQPQPRQHGRPKTPKTLTSCGGHGRLGTVPLGNGRLCSAIVTALDDPDRVDIFFTWLHPFAKELALDGAGCRVVQKLLEVTQADSRDVLFAALAPHTLELLNSPYGNHCLSKAIEVVPSDALRRILDDILEAGPAQVARHRFGCRVLERLIEHCPAEDLAGIAAAVVAEALPLTEDVFGNFAVKSLLEHGTEQVRSEILVQLLPVVPRLVQSRSGSFTVQHALQYCCPEVQIAIAAALIRSRRPSFLDLAVHRAGSFVVEELARLRAPGAAELIEEARGLLRAATTKNRDKALFLKVAATFGVTDL